MTKQHTPGPWRHLSSGSGAIYTDTPEWEEVHPCDSCGQPTIAFDARSWFQAVDYNGEVVPADYICRSCYEACCLDVDEQ